jgi:transposase
MPKTNTVAAIKTIADRQQLLALPKSHLVDLILMMREQLEKQEKQITELHTHIATLQSQVAALQKNSTNSSKPPSSDMPGTGSGKADPAAHHRNSRNPSGRKSGGQPGHQGSTRELIDNPDTVITAVPEACGGCGVVFTDTITDEVIARSQVVDIPPIVPVVTEYQAIARTCACGHTTKGQLPPEAGCTGTVQIGTNASSLLVYLNSAHHLPYQRLQQVASDLFNLSLSQGSIANKLEEAAIAAAPLGQTILDSLHQSAVVGSDETGVRVAGSRIWQWVWQNAKASYYVISKHRDYQTVKDNFGEHYTGCLLHDCYSAQNNTRAGCHQLCHAHLLRDLQFIVDAGAGTIDSAWAYRLQNLLIRSQRARDHIWADDFEADRRESIIDIYHQQLKQYIQQPLTSKDAIRLQKRFLKHKDKILYFITTPDVPPDNNGSERAIRNAKVKQKVSGGYRSHRGAERQATLLSVIETAKKQGLNVLEVIQQLVRGETVRLFEGAE